MEGKGKGKGKGKGREGGFNGGAPSSADLLVCFPSRAHLTLMPRPICSPARQSESRRRDGKSRLRRYSPLGRQGSPLLWGGTKEMEEDMEEPTSPKVTCAGQIKVRPKTAASRSWQSVMEEIEKIHRDGNRRKWFSWVQFLTCLKNIRFDLRCFGSFPESEIAADDGEDEEDEDERKGCPEKLLGGGGEIDRESSKPVFSKRFMFLQDEDELTGKLFDAGRHGDPAAPPPHALLLMRCRSAPSKTWHRQQDLRRDESEGQEELHREARLIRKGRSLRVLMEEEKRKKETQFSCDMDQETWLLGGLKPPLPRSRSCHSPNQIPRRRRRQIRTDK